MSDKANAEVDQTSSTPVLDELTSYRKRRKEELLDECNAIANLGADVSSRIMKSIVNSACNKAFN